MKTRSRLEAGGHRVALAPLLEIVFRTCPGIDAVRYAAILVTSANGVEGLVHQPEGPSLRGLPLYAVGDRTALMAEQCGWTDIRSASGNVNDLAALVSAELPVSAPPLLYGAGVDRSGDLAGALQARGFQVDVFEVYEARAVPVLPDPIVGDLRDGRIDCVLLYSERTARTFVEAVKASGLSETVSRLPIGVMSAPVADVVRQAGCQNAVLAEEATEAALLKGLGLTGIVSGKVDHGTKF
ncbi:MAG: uroporphyrinogen-III synthase [Pseudomonadota bacterium]